MENIAGTKKNFRSEAIHWWYEGSSGTRGTIMFILLLFCLYSLINAQYEQAKTGLYDYTKIHPALYVPANITSFFFDTKELAILTITNKDAFQKIDRSCRFHLVTSKRQHTDKLGMGLYVTYIAKPSDESTHVYLFQQFIADEPHNFWIDLTPVGIKFSDIDAYVSWKYINNGHVFLFVYIAPFVLSIVVALSINWMLTRFLHKQWAKKVSPR
jgi:hypothetical protein